MPATKAPAPPAKPYGYRLDVRPDDPYYYIVLRDHLDGRDTPGQVVEHWWNTNVRISALAHYINGANKAGQRLTDPDRFTYRHTDEDGMTWVIPPDQKSDFFERETIPCPRVREGVETKWERGIWWKWTKTYGWVPL